MPHQMLVLYVLVRSFNIEFVIDRISTIFFYFVNDVFIDSCRVQNGGCDANAICSHDKSTNAVVCTCKTGYTNTGTAPTVICKGRFILITIFH